MAYERIEPFGPLPAFQRTGILAAMISNTNRTKDSQPIAKAEDFLPTEYPWEAEEADEPDENERKKIADQIRRAFGEYKAAIGQQTRIQRHG